MEHHEIIKILERQLRVQKDHVAVLRSFGKYNDAADSEEKIAEALQYALDNLSLDGPLTFSARYFKEKYEALAEPTPGMVVRALVAAHPERGVYTDTEFNQMQAALKAGWGLPPG